MSTKPGTTAEYVATLTDEQQATLERLRATVRAAAPDAEEVFSYGIPGFRLGGRPLLWIAAWRRHYAVYPISADEVTAMAAPGDVFEVEKSTIRFPVGTPLPYDLVTRLVQARVGKLAAGARDVR